MESESTKATRQMLGDVTAEAVETDCVECGNALQIALPHGLHPVATPGHNLHVALLDYRTCGGGETYAAIG